MAVDLRFKTELSIGDKMQLIRSSEWAQNFNAVEVDQLGVYLKACVIPVDTVIFKEGETNTFFCLICDGKVDVLKENAAGEVKKLITMGAGKMIGEISFFDNNTCSASIVVKDDVTVLVLDKSNLTKLSVDYPSIALRITLNLVSNLCKRLRQTTGQLIDHL